MAPGVPENREANLRCTSRDVPEHVADRDDRERLAPGDNGNVAIAAAVHFVEGKGEAGGGSG